MNYDKYLELNNINNINNINNLFLSLFTLKIKHEFKLMMNLKNIIY
jgi:hypothetical protein